MYCSYCGCKLNNTLKTCPSCGKEALIEYCGGFWGLVGDKKQGVANTLHVNLEQEDGIAQKNRTEETDLEETRIEEKGMSKKQLEDTMNRERINGIKQRILIGILAIMTLTSVIQTIRLAFSNKDNLKLRDERDSIEEKYDNLVKDHEELEKNYSLLETEYEELKDGVNEIREPSGTEEDQPIDDYNENSEVDDQEELQHSNSLDDEGMNIEDEEILDESFEIPAFNINPLDSIVVGL